MCVCVCIHAWLCVCVIFVADGPRWRGWASWPHGACCSTKMIFLCTFWMHFTRSISVNIMDAISAERFNWWSRTPDERPPLWEYTPLLRLLFWNFSNPCIHGDNSLTKNHSFLNHICSILRGVWKEWFHCTILHTTIFFSARWRAEFPCKKEEREV